MPDRLLATELARALDGEQTQLPEAEELALLLRSAADVARFDVDPREAEQQLAEARRRVAGSMAAKPRRSPFRLTPRRALAGGLAAAAIAVAVLIALPESTPPGIDVESRALAAITEGPPILRAVTETSAAGRPEKVVRIEWVDSEGGRLHVQVQVGARVISETLVENRRVTQYQPQARRAVIASSCTALPGGCAALLDPIGFYRRALEQRDAGAAQTVDVGGRPGYRFTIPVQALGGSTNLIEQQVTVDAETFLPITIVWHEQAPGDAVPSTVAVVDVVSIEHLGEDQAPEAFSIDLPADTRIVQVASGGDEIGRPQEQPATLDQARAALPGVRWLGQDYQGFALERVTIVRWPAVPAVAVRFDYGPLTLWSFDRVIPEPLLEGTVVPEKLIGDDQGVVRFYVARDGRIVAERDHPGISVAAVGPEFEKLDLFAAVDSAEPL